MLRLTTDCVSAGAFQQVRVRDHRLRDGRMDQERMSDLRMLAMVEEGCGERSAETVEVEALIPKIHTNTAIGQR